MPRGSSASRPAYEPGATGADFPSAQRPPIARARSESAPGAPCGSPTTIVPGRRLLEAAATLTASPVQQVSCPRRAHGDDLARVDADPDLEPSPYGPRASFHLRKPLSIRARTHGSLGVVLVSNRHPEGRHHRIADELLHGAARGLDLPRIATK